MFVLFAKPRIARRIKKISISLSQSIIWSLRKRFHVEMCTYKTSGAKVLLFFFHFSCRCVSSLIKNKKKRWLNTSETVKRAVGKCSTFFKKGIKKKDHVDLSSILFYIYLRINFSSPIPLERFCCVF